MGILDEIAGTLAVFHDGGIDAVHADDAGTLTLTVACLYLAERISPSYRVFTLKIHGVREAAFQRWMNDRSHPGPLTALDEIFAGDLESLSAAVKENAVVWTLNQADPRLPYVGGDLTFAGTAVEVRDEGGKLWPLAELRQLASDYWEDWRKKGRRE